MTTAPRLARRGLIAEITLWGAGLLLVGVALVFSAYSLAERKVARDLADWQMIDFLEDEVAPAVGECDLLEPRLRATCRNERYQNESGGVWTLVDGGGERHSSFTFGIAIGVGFSGADCARRDPQRLGDFVFYTCSPLDDGVSYRFAEMRDLMADGMPGALLAVEQSVWSQREARAIERAGARRWTVTLITVLAAGAAFGGALFMMARRLSDHFERLSRELDGYLRADQPRIQEAYPLEIQRLVDGFNRAIDKNERLIDRQRRNVSKMAHDLRHQMVNVDVASRDGDRDGVGKELDLLGKLVERYLTLVDWVGPTDSQGWSDVCQTLEDVRRAFSRRLRLTPIEIEVDCSKTLEVRLHPTDLKIILMNLVSNAHKFADGRIRIGASIERGRDFVLTIDDDGPGIPAADRDRALGWGGRLDDAAPGSGFGLTIVAEQVRELYGGDVRLDAAPLGGLRAQVTVPEIARNR